MSLNCFWTILIPICQSTVPEPFGYHYVTQLFQIYLDTIMLHNSSWTILIPLCLSNCSWIILISSCYPNNYKSTLIGSVLLHNVVMNISKTCKYFLPPRIGLYWYGWRHWFIKMSWNFLDILQSCAKPSIYNSSWNMRKNRALLIHFTIWSNITSVYFRGTSSLLVYA